MRKQALLVMAASSIYCATAVAQPTPPPSLHDQQEQAQLQQLLRAPTTLDASFDAESSTATDFIAKLRATVRANLELQKMLQTALAQQMSKVEKLTTELAAKSKDTPPLAPDPTAK